METKTPGSMVGAYVLSPAPFKGAVVVVYLRPLGRFLFVGHWPGYESSIVSGEWSVAEQVIILNGEGSVHADIGHTASQQFKGVFQIQEGSDGAALVGVEGKDSRNGWSLLSWKGHFVFRGQNHFEPYTSTMGTRDLPRSLEEVEHYLGLP